MRTGLLWILAAIAGALGAFVLFDAAPGINWVLWTALAAAGLLIYRRPDPERLRVVALPLGAAIILAAGASVTTAPLIRVAIVAMVASLLALSVLVVSAENAALDYGPIEILTAPFRALGRTISGVIAAAISTFDSLGTAHERPALRGAVIAVPVVLVLALLFASADPLLARGRDALYDVFGSWADIPRIVFGLLLTLFVLGAYAATRAADTRFALAGPKSTADTPRIGLTERRIVLVAAAAVSWLFVLLQLSYLFGASPAIGGSGVTFAEYAHRGFGELTVAATIAALLIIAAHENVNKQRDARFTKTITWPSLILLAAVVCILGSAFHRILLYEDAYGFTTARVYGQAYMLLALVVLLVLVWHVLRSFDVRALARQIMTVALATLAILAFWNVDSFVARANIERYAQTGKIDVQYLARDLSLDAYPTLVRSLPAIRQPEREQLATALAAEYARSSDLHRADSWYEWNLRRERARSYVVVTHPAKSPPAF